MNNLEEICVEKIYFLVFNTLILREIANTQRKLSQITSSTHTHTKYVVKHQSQLL